nr:12869_t:CDS:2 [Entrophospora candida]
MPPLSKKKRQDRDKSRDEKVMGNNSESGWDNVEDIEEENKNISMELKESGFNMQ